MAHMRSANRSRFGQIAAVVTATLISAAVGFGAVAPTQAQIPDLNLLNKLKSLKKAPGNAPVQVPRRGAVGVPGLKGPGIPGRPGFANRPGIGPNGVAMPNGRMPNGLPNNAHINPATANTKTGLPGGAGGLNAKPGGTPGLSAKGGGTPALNAKTGGTPAASLN